MCPFTWQLFTETLLYVVIETISIMYSYKTLSSVLPGNTFQNVSSKTTHVPQHSLYPQVPKKKIKVRSQWSARHWIVLRFPYLSVTQDATESEWAYFGRYTCTETHILPSLTYKLLRANDKKTDKSNKINETVNVVPKLHKKAILRL